MNILFLAPYPKGQAPSQRYRFEHYLPYLEEKDIRYEYHPFLDEKTWAVFFRKGFLLMKISGLVKGTIRRMQLMFKLNKFDYVYVHREAAPMGPPVFEWIIARLWRKKMIYDFDDAIWIPAASSGNAIGLYIKAFWKIKWICRWAYHITPGNNYLKTFAERYNTKITVIPTVVDTIYTNNRVQQHHTAHPVLGWTGSFSTLKYLDIVVALIRELQQEIRFSVIVIADRDPMLPLENYAFVPWDKATEIDDLMRIHVGIMPLYDDDLSKGKCGFKAIQYMSLGIPAVVSPVGVNTVIVDDGLNGFICHSNDEWKNHLRSLLTNHAEREAMGNRAIDKIRQYYSVNATVQTFIQLFYADSPGI